MQWKPWGQREKVKVHSCGHWGKSSKQLKPKKKEADHTVGWKALCKVYPSYACVLKESHSAKGWHHEKVNINSEAQCQLGRMSKYNTHINLHIILKQACNMRMLLLNQKRRRRNQCSVGLCFPDILTLKAHQYSQMLSLRSKFHSSLSLRSRWHEHFQMFIPVCTANSQIASWWRGEVARNARDVQTRMP